jgi:hypothetical protein
MRPMRQDSNISLMNVSKSSMAARTVVSQKNLEKKYQKKIVSHRHPLRTECPDGTRVTISLLARLPGANPREPEDFANRSSQFMPLHFTPGQVTCHLRTGQRRTHQGPTWNRARPRSSVETQNPGYLPLHHATPGMEVDVLVVYLWVN